MFGFWLILIEVVEEVRSSRVVVVGEIKEKKEKRKISHIIFDPPNSSNWKATKFQSGFFFIFVLPSNKAIGKIVQI